MRIEALHLAAFGPFTDATLDFTRDDPGFHLVYGPNEAGKSSALRALRSLLYGIDERTPDSFIHPYPRLRIGGKLAADDGRRLEVVRRKGRTNTLRADDDQTVVDEALLAGFLNHVDEDLFATMFGIGYDDLVAGGKAIVSGGGDLGQLVFSAGSGIVRLKEIRDALQAEAENLFKPSGKNPAVNTGLSRLKEIEKQLKETLLPGNQWTRLDEDLKNAVANRKSVEAELKKNEKTRQYLARIKEALPLIARRREAADTLKAYQDTPLLPDDFPETRRDLVTKLDMARREAERADGAVAAIEKEMAEITPGDTLIENAALIEAFHRQLGSQRKAETDRIKLETERAALRDECREILRNLSDGLALEDAEHLRIKKDRAAAIRRLSSEYEQIAARIESAREALPGLEEEIKQLEEKRRQMTPSRDPKSMDALQTALAEAHEYGPLEKQNQQTLKELENQQSVLENRLSRLGLSGKTAHDLEKLPVPERETIQRFEDRFDQADRQIQEITRARKKAAEQIATAEADIRAGQMAQTVPSEDDLNAARALRDQGWHLIRQKLADTSADTSLDQEALAAVLSEAEHAETLEDAFEHHVKKSDELADRLRREADRVAAHARLKADLERAQQQKAALDGQYEKAQGDAAELHDQWARLWAGAGVAPSPPREMDRWRRDMAAITEALAAFENNRRKAADLSFEIRTCRDALAGALKSLDRQTDFEKIPLSRLIFRAQQIIDGEKALAAEYEKIDSDLGSCRKAFSAAGDRLKAGEQALERWRTHWQAAVSPLGLSAEARPEEADAVMEEIRTLFEKLRDAETLQKRIQGIDRDAKSFADGVSGLAHAVAPDLAGLPPEDIALKLHARLTESRESRTRCDTLERQLASEKRHLENARKTAAEIETRLARMCEEAGCGDYRDLPGIEQRSEKRRALEAELKSIEQRLLALSAGATVAEFAAEAGAVDPDTLDPEIDRCDTAIAELGRQKDTLAETIGSLKNELSKMDGSAKAAMLEEERQEILGRLDPGVRQYSRVKLAARILDRAIERFREKNQGPILRRASELFARITCGSFQGVRAEFDEAAAPVITGVRSPGGEPVHVTGMSDGTADQLYLALRLAGLEMTIEKTGPMPFIVDDILIKFDNERAAAALNILADLSACTQVIFFTHHAHLIELARQQVPETSVTYHEL